MGAELPVDGDGLHMGQSETQPSEMQPRETGRSSWPGRGATGPDTARHGAESHDATGTDPARATRPRRRVLHVITRLIRGGADENTLLTIAGLDPGRFETDLVVGSESELEHLSVPDHVHVTELPHLVRDVHLWHDLRALVDLVKLIRGGRYDLVHTHTAKAGILGRMAAAIVGVPVVIHTLHGTTFHPYVNPWTRRLYVFAERLAARMTHRFISVGDDVGERYVAAGVVKPGGYRIIYSGMDISRFVAARSMSIEERRALRADVSLEMDDQVVGVVARLEARKGHRYLFEAVARLASRFPHLRLLVVGDGGMKGALEQQAVQLGIGDRVCFAGFRQDIDRVLAMIDVAALTSLWEGLPRSLVQAALVSKPILTFDVEGVREIVRDGENGFVVPIGDVDALTRRLGEMLEERGRTEAMGRRHLEDIESRWSASRMVNDIESIYEETLDDSLEAA